MSPTHQDLSNDTTFSQIKSRVPVPLSASRIRDPDPVFKILICWIRIRPKLDRIRNPDFYLAVIKK